jgi:hypothetical protein
MRARLSQFPLFVLLLACPVLAAESPGQMERVQRDVRPQFQRAAVTAVKSLAAQRLDLFVARPAAGDARVPFAVQADAVARRNVMLERNAFPIDYGLVVRVLSVRESDSGVHVVYTAGISTLTEQYGEHEYEYDQEYHRATVVNGVVVADEIVEIDHPDFNALVALDVQEEHVVKELFGDPFVVPEPSRESKERLPVQSLIARPSDVKSYAAGHCATGTYNKSYPNYNKNGDGGDCTNFVSQVLEAGGLAFRDKKTDSRRKTDAKYWWTNPSKHSDHSISWSTAYGLRNHFTSRFGSASSTVHWVWEDAHVGDVVFFNFNRVVPDKWNHACVVTTAERTWWGSFRLKVSCHTTDRCDKSLYDITAGKNWWLQIVHVP